MLIYSAEEHINLLQNSILLPIRKVLDESESVFGFLLMGQAIEILGSYLDDKPMRAKQQSASRFSIAVYKLFPGKYSSINRKNFLYIQLRACLTHMFIPTEKLSLNFGFDKDESKHLYITNDVLFLFSENLFRDLEIATNTLIKRISEGKMKLKKISLGEINTSLDFQV